MSRNRYKTKTEFVGWTHTICKKCKKLFPIFDKFGQWNELPPDNEYYCSECEQKGYKSKKVKPPKMVPVRLTPQKFLKVNSINDKLIIKFFKKVLRERGKHRTYNSILKEAIELADLHREN